MISITGLGNLNKIFTIRPNITVEQQSDQIWGVVQYPSTGSKGYSYGIFGKRKIKMTFTLSDFAIRKQLFEFWKDKQGSYKKFWCPTWLHEFELADTCLQSAVLKVKNTNFRIRYQGHERLFILTKNEDFIVRKILNVGYDSDYNIETFTVDTAIPITLQPKDIALFGRVLLVRFDGNELKEEITDINTNVTQITVIVTELIHEYEEVET